MSGLRSRSMRNWRGLRSSPGSGQFQTWVQSGSSHWEQPCRGLGGSDGWKTEHEPAVCTKRPPTGCCFSVSILQLPPKCLFCQEVSSRGLVQHPSGEVGFPWEVPSPRSPLCPLQPEMRFAFLRLQRGDQTWVISATEWSASYLNKKIIFLTRWKMNCLLIAMITFLMT